MKGLIIKEPWIDMILDGRKTWEIRGSNTKIRGTIALIKSGTGEIYGTVDLVDTNRLAKVELFFHYDNHKIPNYDEIKYRHIWAWDVRNPIRYPEPIPYKHPQGAVIWVNLGEGVSK